MHQVVLARPLTVAGPEGGPEKCKEGPSISKIALHLPSPGLCIAAVLGQKFGVRSRFGDAAIGHDMDVVGLHRGGKAMRDEKDSSAGRQASETIQPIALCPGIHGAGGFVQDEQWRRAQEGPLALATTIPEWEIPASLLREWPGAPDGLDPLLEKRL